MVTQTNKPVPGVMVGLTHTKDLTPIIREPRVLKVGIGVPKGRASYVYTHQGKWIVRYGAWSESGGKNKLDMKTAKFDTRAATEEWYHKNKSTFAVSNRPQKIPFFTFTRRMIVETGGKPEEVFEPDFAAIEAHGDTPREIDIVFMGDNPLSGEYQAWSATELKCHGDGLNALRVIQLGTPEWPGWNEAKEAGDKYFPVGECYESGLCPYAQEGGKDKLVCKPSATLTFQLANSIRLGATSYFATTSFRSVRQLFSSLEIIKGIAERAGSGIANTPLKLVLAPFRTNHNGIAATQYGVSLELRTQDVQKLRQLLADAAWKPVSPRLIAAAEEEVATEMTATAVTAEFYPDAVFDDDGDPEDPASTQAAQATQQKTEELATALKNKRDNPPKAKGSEKMQATVATIPVSGETDTRQSTGTTSEIPPAPTPGTDAPSAQGTDDENPWPARVTDTFLSQIGGQKFNLALMQTFGSTDVGMVNATNHKDVWVKMTKAKAEMEMGQPPTGDLF